MVVGKLKQSFIGKNLTLLKVAGISGFLVCSAGYFFKTMIERKFTKSEFYQKAIEHVMAHRALVNYLGEPITFGSVDISKKGKNYATDTSAACEVPIRGAKEKGKMQFTAVRREIKDDIKSDTFKSISNTKQVSNGYSPSRSQTDSKNYEEECIYCKPVKLSQWEIERIEVSIDNRPNERVIVPCNNFIKS